MHSCGSFWHDVPMWIVTAFPFLGVAYFKARAWIRGLQAPDRAVARGRQGDSGGEG